MGIKPQVYPRSTLGIRCHRLTAGTRLGGKGESEPLHLAQTSSARDDGRVGQRMQGESIPEEMPVPNSFQAIVPP